MLKINLFGKYSQRTPLSYKDYITYFDKVFIYKEKDEEADYLISGTERDFRENALKIEYLLTKNPNLKLVVLSEEPFWDTVWSGNELQHKKVTISIKHRFRKITFEYYNLNHITSRIFDFRKIPYYITTNNNFYIRYKKMFERNAKLDANYYESIWKNSLYKYSFFATRRVGKMFETSYNNGNIKGLSRFRSLVCEELIDDSFCVGKGYGTECTRQDLDDWHLDKLAKLDKNSFIVSALENTHVDNYISEKIFDAFAVQAIPLYYAQPNHRVFDLITDGSFINLAGKSVEEAIKSIEEFEVDGMFMEKYIDAQRKMFELFSDQKYYIDERKRIVDEVVKAFAKIK